jgi:hypothetical protein
MLAWSQIDIPDEVLNALGRIVVGVFLIALLLGFLGMVFIVRMIRQSARKRKK